jgi:hypothetical protein
MSEQRPRAQGEEQREYIKSKTAWYVSTIAERTAELTLLRHLREHHDALIPDDVLRLLESRLRQLIQSFSAYRLQKKEKEVSQKD